MRSSDDHVSEGDLQRMIRRDSHVAAGCGLALALFVVSALIIYVLVIA